MLSTGSIWPSTAPNEVDAALFQLIKGGGRCHVQEKLVARRGLSVFVVVVMPASLVERLNLEFLCRWKCCRPPGAR